MRFESFETRIVSVRMKRGRAREAGEAKGAWVIGRTFGTAIGTRSKGAKPSSRRTASAPTILLLLILLWHSDKIAKIGSESSIFVKLADPTTGLTLSKEKYNVTRLNRSNQFAFDDCDPKL